MKKNKLDVFAVYQVVVLISIILLNSFYFYFHKELNETLTGCLIGLAIGIPNTMTDK